MLYCIVVDQTLFGIPLRADALILTASLGETYTSELARLLGKPLYSVQRAIAGLERAGVISSRRRGSVRIVSLNTRYFAYRELYPLLLRLSEDQRYRAILRKVRRRPRAGGKSL
jgi:DNA-binding transcriptional ArsR family regulator